MYPAFSRDQENKIYVQNRIKENSKLIQELIEFESAYILLVGNSKILPKYVDKALVYCLRENSGNFKDLKDEEIYKFLNILKNKGIYYTETW